MIDESIRVLELPMMFESADELDYVADKMWPNFAKKFEKKGFKLHDRGEVGWVYFLSKDKVESSPTSRARSCGCGSTTRSSARLFKQLGAQRRAARRARGRCRPDRRA